MTPCGQLSFRFYADQSSKNASYSAFVECAPRERGPRGTGHADRDVMDADRDGDQNEPTPYAQAHGKLRDRIDLVVTPRLRAETAISPEMTAQRLYGAAANARCPRSGRAGQASLSIRSPP